MAFVLGLVVGIAVGLVVIGFLAVGSYWRGYDEAKRAPWRSELRARRVSLRKVATAA